jgi:hypothetical protein
MTKNLVAVSNFPKKELPGEAADAEGLIESGTALGTVDDDVAKKLIDKGWAKEVEPA